MIAFQITTVFKWPTLKQLINARVFIAMSAEQYHTNYNKILKFGYEILEN